VVRARHDKKGGSSQEFLKVDCPAAVNVNIVENLDKCVVVELHVEFFKAKMQLLGIDLATVVFVDLCKKLWVEFAHQSQSAACCIHTPLVEVLGFRG
jgi:hypothetical protein